MLKKLASWIMIIAFTTVMFHGCSKPPPPPPVSVNEVEEAYNDAMDAKAQYDALEKERDLLKAELKEKQDRLDTAKNCAEGE